MRELLCDIYYKVRWYTFLEKPSLCMIYKLISKNISCNCCSFSHHYKMIYSERLWNLSLRISLFQFTEFILKTKSCSKSTSEVREKSKNLLTLDVLFPGIASFTEMFIPFWLYVFIMSRALFRVNLQPIVSSVK